MIRLIGLAVSIGLADSLNPSTIAPALYLASGERPRAAVAQFTLGVFIVYFLGGAVIVLGPGSVLFSLIPHPGHTVRYVLELLAGIVVLIGAAVLWINRRKLSQRDLPEPSSEGKSSVLLGVTITAVELPTAFPYFAVLAATLGSGLDPVRQLIVVLIYNLCFVLPLVGIVATLTIAGERAERILQRARDALQRNWPVVLAALALLAGLFVTLLGATGLASHGHGPVANVSRKLRRVIHR